VTLCRFPGGGLRTRSAHAAPHNYNRCMQATRIIAVRHGETAWNVDTRIQGQRNIPLNPQGTWQAERLAQALRSHTPFAAIYSSDLLRTMDTAQPIASATGVGITPEPGLRERGFGEFEGLTFTELELHSPVDTARWRQRDPDWAPPGGETLTAVRDRITATVQRLAQRHVGEQIVLVTHGGVFDALYRVAVGSGDPRTTHLATRQRDHQPTALDTGEGMSSSSDGTTAAHLQEAWMDEATA
jgi:probable phosphoglycerate mutase